VIDWIDYKLRSWGHAKHRLLTAQEGSPQSLMGRIMTHGPAAGDSRQGLQVFREGMTGDALECSLAIYRAMMAHAMTDRQYEVLFVHYACKGYQVGYKAKALGITRPTYYTTLHRAQTALEPCFTV